MTSDVGPGPVRRDAARRSDRDPDSGSTADAPAQPTGQTGPEPAHSRRDAGGARPELQADTPMQKVVLPGLVDLFLGNVVIPGRFEPHRFAGFVTRLADVPAATAADLSRRYGLDQVPGWPTSRDLHVLRFFAHTPVGYDAPFGRSIFQMDLAELPAGTELWRIDERGEEQRVAAYLHRQIGWVTTTPVFLGPARWNLAPVPLRPTVRRGPVARYRGADFDADFGPQPGEVTLHPLPNQQAPDDFTEQAGARFRTVPAHDLDSLQRVRWLGVWQGLTIELVDAAADHLTVQYQGEDGQRASDLGLAEVDYRVWRGPVPRAEVGEVSDEATPLS